MKTFAIAALVASLVGAPAIAAPYQGHQGSAVHREPMHAGQYHSWRKGERFDTRQAHNYRVISAPRSYHLKAPPRGYRWVQSGNDAVLIGITSGLVASVIANAVH